MIAIAHVKATFRVGCVGRLTFMCVVFPFEHVVLLYFIHYLLSTQRKPQMPQIFFEIYQNFLDKICTVFTSVTIYNFKTLN